jgi:Na+/H+ antiporter NhaD/arsenite permease-like protein
MSPTQTALASILALTLLVQALLPRFRLLTVTAGAALSCLAAALAGVGTTAEILAAVPWQVIVILVALGLLSELLVHSRVFGVLAAAAARRTAGHPGRLITTFAVGMYVISGLVNNLTALLLVLPVLLIVLKLSGVGQRYVSWTVGVLLVACNLGGAASPIGDFPAILLLGSGSMGFVSYLTHAAPPTAVALLVLLAIVRLAVRPDRDVDPSPLGRELSVAVVSRLYRNVRIDFRRFVPPAAALAAMLVAWTVIPATGRVGPELIAWLGGAAALVAAPRLGERLVRDRVEVEAVLFLLALFIMVEAVRRTGLFDALARAITGLPIAPELQLVAFLALAGVVTGLVSAGPSMAALLEVARTLAATLPPAAVYVGLALSVCAGSSLLLTAATSGPLAQALTERADLRDETGAPIRFGFFQFLPVGLLSFTVILASAIVAGLGLVAWNRRP